MKQLQPQSHEYIGLTNKKQELWRHCTHKNDIKELQKLRKTVPKRRVIIVSQLTTKSKTPEGDVEIYQVSQSDSYRDAALFGGGMGVECCSIMERGVSLVVFCETRRLTCASSSWHVIIPWSSLYRKRRSRRVRRQLRETGNGNLDTAKAVSGGPEEKRCLYIDRNLVWTRSIRLLLEWQVPFHTTEAYSSWGIQSVLNSFRNELGDRKSRENLHTAPRERRARRVSWSTWGEKVKALSKSTPRSLIPSTLDRGPPSMV